MSFVHTPPRVSRPRESGVTSRSTRSSTSPESTPAWMAAPSATTSSGFTVAFGARPAYDSTSCCTAGMRVLPPTSTTSSTAPFSSPASLSAVSMGPLRRSRRPDVLRSSAARVSVASMCSGPASVAVTKGMDMSVLLSVESSSFAFTAASVRRWSAPRSPDRSTPRSLLKSSTSQSTMTLSQSSPPRCVSPAVASTSNTPSPTSRMDTSNVPPPRSNTRMVSCTLRSNPYARLAAVGSLITRRASRPAMRAASLVAWRCESLKYAGTVTTAWETSASRKRPASSASLRMTSADTSSGANLRPSTGASSLMLSVPCSGTTL
mmetsp:Transcript_14899/g.51167  ORF Transcript_14899/g.51167 Transcript_14899/m.51167 type:complete len:320 (-) Transcript_14899:270-1229(-)